MRLTAPMVFPISPHRCNCRKELKKADSFVPGQLIIVSWRFSVAVVIITFHLILISFPAAALTEK